MKSLAFSYRTRETKKNGIVYDVVFRIRDDTGKMMQKTLCGYKTKALAKKAYMEYMSSYIAPPIKHTGKTELKFIDAYQNYCGYLKYEKKESTLYTIIHTFEPHILPYFKDKNMFRLKTEDIKEWQKIMTGKTKEDGNKYSNARIKTIWTYFKSFIRWSNKEYETPDIFKNLTAPKKKEIKKAYTIWTKEQFEQYYQNINILRDKALFRVLYYSGMRIGELQALTPEDYKDGKLHIYKTYTKKTLDNTPYKITELKNYKEHYIPLPKHTKEILENWLNYKQENKLPNKYIFGGDNPISPNAIKNAHTKYTQKANLPTIRIHDFRHSYASLLVSIGTNFSVIATLLGDSLDQIIKTYAHTTESDIIKAINSI